MAKFKLTNKQAKALGALAAALVAGALGIGGPALDSLTPDQISDSDAPAISLSADETGDEATDNTSVGDAAESDASTGVPAVLTLADVPAYDDSPYVVINADASHPDGTPSFTESETARAEQGTFEDYSPLDSLGRCGTAFACLGRETMPTGDRGSIREIKPTGWRQHFYDFVDQEALYNRCHLIAWSLSAENANAQNLITGTRSMNTQGMLPFEEETVAYIRRTNNHVLYRATPLFEGQNMLASGVHLEAESVEDGGRGLSFNIYCYNVEPGVGIDYATGNNWESGDA